MAEILTAAMAQTIHWSPELADESAWNALDAIADDSHVVIPAEELERLKADAGKLSLYDAAMDAIREACDKIMGGNLDFIDDDFARCLYSMMAERDRLAGINRQMLDALTVLLMEAETFSVSGVYFAEPCMQHKGPALAHAAIAAATRGREE